MSNLYDWVFHYNPYTKKWNAAKREDYVCLFNGPKSKVLSSSSIETLSELITRTNGNRKKIETLCK